MRVLGIETSCDETGLAIYDSERGLLAHALHSQVAMHEAYGGVVPELASRDHIRRVVPLVEQVLARGGHATRAISTASPTRRARVSQARSWWALASRTRSVLRSASPCIGVHHLEGHLLSPLLAIPSPRFRSSRCSSPADTASSSRSQGSATTRCSGDTLDDAAGEAFDKTAKLLGLPYPGGPALAQARRDGTARRGRPAAADEGQRRSRHELLAG